jgi:hypothetical protein
VRTFPLGTGTRKRNLSGDGGPRRLDWIRLGHEDAPGSNQTFEGQTEADESGSLRPKRALLGPYRDRKLRVTAGVRRHDRVVRRRDGDGCA